jgi:drug/metabolite transporter (DMT)-like permease
VPFALYAYATRSVPAGFAAVLNATVPLFGALLGRLSFKESLGPMRALGLGVGFVGVLVLVSRDLSVDGRPLAIAAALSASLMYALSAHLTRRVLPGVPSVVIAAGSLVVSVVLLAIPAALTWPAVMPSFGAWMATLALAALATGLGYILYFRLLDNAGATGAMAVTYLIPLFGMVWGGIFLGERVTLPMLIGSAFILLGVAITTGTVRALFARRER